MKVAYIEIQIDQIRPFLQNLAYKISQLAFAYFYLQIRCSNRNNNLTIGRSPHPKMTEQIKQNYIVDILEMLKNLSFHQLYMETLRQKLSDNQSFDPFTAFKFVDSFKHNMIIGVELKNFMQMHNVQITNAQAEEVIKALNKSEDSLNYDRFVQMVMPYNLRKKNLSLTRYNRLEVSIGTYSRINEIKSTSRSQITKFFTKQVQFYRDFTFQRQQFCRKWGGDIFTITQQLFKIKTEDRKSTKNPLLNYQNREFDRKETQNSFQQIDFKRFYEFGRKYNYYFNKQQFKSVWRRIKSVQQDIVLKAEEIFLKRSDLANILLVSNFNTKLKYASQYSIPLKDLQAFEPPSYKLPISVQLTHNSYDYRKEVQTSHFDRKIQQMKRQMTVPSYGLKSKCSYPELANKCVSIKLRQKQEQWKEIFSTMNEPMISQRYAQILGQGKDKHYR